MFDVQASLEPIPHGLMRVGPAASPQCIPDEKPPEAEPMTLVEFVERVFVPEHVAAKHRAGRTHYQALLKHVLRPEEVDRVFRADTRHRNRKLKAIPNWPYLGGVRLCEVGRSHVQELIAAALAAGYSDQTVQRLRSVISVIFAHAEKRRCFVGANPASGVALPQAEHPHRTSLSLAQAREVLGAMQYPEKEMALISMLTPMNLEEICGLQWQYVNLADSWHYLDGDAIPPKSIAVRRQWCHGELETVNKRSRMRNVPIPGPLLPVLLGLKQRGTLTGADDFVLVSAAGTPINHRFIAVSRLRPIGQTLRMPWLSWRVLHRTGNTLAYELGIRCLDGILG